MDQVTSNARRDKRNPLLLNARCRKSPWLVDHVELANISEGGCCIVGGGEGLVVGQDVKIRFADLKGVPGKICWIESRIAGVQFDEPLDAELVAELGDTYSFAAPNVVDIRSYTARDDEVQSE